MDEYPNQYYRELNTIEEISVVQFERYHLPTSVHIDLFKIKYNLEKKFIQKIYQHIPRNARAELIRLKKKINIRSSDPDREKFFDRNCSS